MIESERVEQAAGEIGQLRSQSQMVWRRFRRHRVAIVGGVVLAVLYLMAAFAGFFSAYDPNYYTLSAPYAFAPPTPIHFRDPKTGLLTRPFVYAEKRTLNLNTFQTKYVPDTSKKYYIHFFVRTPSQPYTIFKIFHTDLRFLGVDAPARIYLAGTDNLGRSQWARLVYGGQISLTVGILSVIVSLVLGLLLGGIAGYYQGTRLRLSPGWMTWLKNREWSGAREGIHPRLSQWLGILLNSAVWLVLLWAVAVAVVKMVQLTEIGWEKGLWVVIAMLLFSWMLRALVWKPFLLDPDDLIMRVVEVVAAIPGLFLLISLRAVFPLTMDPAVVFYVVVGILGFIGWGGLARTVRGMILGYREADFVQAARSLGASDGRVIVRHILPSTLGYVIVTTSIAIPVYILAESGLSFLGVGVVPPYVSWGLLLKAAQDGGIATFTDHPWMLAPGIFIFLAVLAWNFLGDGLRDSFDPRSSRG